MPSRRFNGTLAETRPTLANLAVITGNLRDPNGSLGNWLFPTNLTAQLNQTLQSARETLGAARGTLDTTDTNLTKVATDLDETLQHLSDLTSNLAWQVHVNTNLVSDIVDDDCAYGRFGSGAEAGMVLARRIQEKARAAGEGRKTQGEVVNCVWGFLAYDGG